MHRPSLKVEETDSPFKRMMKEYLMIGTMKQAESWIDKCGCGGVNRETFLQYAFETFKGEDNIPLSYEDGQDWADRFRRCGEVRG